MKQKIYSDIDAAIADVPDGARMMFGGFGGAGFPQQSHSGARPQRHEGYLRNQQQLRHARRRTRHSLQAQSHSPRHRVLSRPSLQLFPGTPRGQRSHHRTRATGNFVRTHARRRRWPARFLHRSGRRNRSRRREKKSASSTANAAFSKCRSTPTSPLSKPKKPTRLGNLTYHLAAQNFNPIMAMAAKTTIVEVEEIVPTGSIDPESVMTPAIFVHRIVQAKGIRYAG